MSERVDARGSTAIVALYDASEHEVPVENSHLVRPQPEKHTVRHARCRSNPLTQLDRKIRPQHDGRSLSVLLVSRVEPQ